MNPTDPGRPSTKRVVFAAILVLLLALFCALRLHHLDAVCLDADEAFSLLTARHGWGGTWAAAADDISHPPLFYLLLKLWIGVGGESLLWLRLLPAIVSVSATVPFLLICRDRRLPPLATCLALFLCATNGTLIFYAQHLRDFILLQALSLWSLWFFARYADGLGSRRLSLWGLFLANLLAVYAHYWGWLLVGTEFLVLLLGKRKCLPFLLTSLLLLVCYAPWAWSVAQVIRAKGTATAQIDWIGRPALREIAWFQAQMNGIQAFPRSTLLGSALFGAPILLWCLAALRGRAGDRSARSAHLVPLLLFTWIPTLVTFAASHLLPQSVWATRQLLFAMVPYFLLVSIGVARLDAPLLRGAFVLALSAWSMFAGILAIRTECVKEPWDELFATLVAREAAEGGTGDVVLYADEDFFVHAVELHLRQRFGPRFRHVTVKSYGDVEGDRFWVIYRKTRWKEDPPPQDALERMGYRCGEESAIEAGMRILVFPVRR